MTDSLEHSETNERYIVGVFTSIQKAQDAIAALAEEGYTTDEISVISSEETLETFFPEKISDHSDEGWKYAAALGGGSGALLASSTAIAILGATATIPIVVIGALAGLFTGGVVGSLIGAMTERGFESEATDFYAQAVAEGRCLVVLERKPSETPRTSPEEILAAAGAEPIELQNN